MEDSNIKEFTPEKLLEKLEKLINENHDLKTANESNQQLIYELRRNLETCLASEQFLSHEIELISASNEAELHKAKINYTQNLEEYYHKYHELEAQNLLLEQNIQHKSEENNQLKIRIKVLGDNSNKLLDLCASCAERSRAEALLEAENLKLLSAIDKNNAKYTKALFKIAEYEKKLDISNEKIECLDQNVNCKQEELDEITKLYESAQVKISELTAELGRLPLHSEDNAKKGNSLFAEVDDQRQAMKKLLITQKRHYNEMKKIYEESQRDIFKLKRENVAMHKELEICSSVFSNADKTYKENLVRRMTRILENNDKLESRLMQMEENLKQMACSKGLNWLDSMLTIYKEETNDLKSQLRECRIRNSIVEEQLKNVTQDYIKWRFEALKSRCIIIDRESILEKNKIAFESVPSSSLNMTKNTCEKARPTIVFDQNVWVEEKQIPKYYSFNDICLQSTSYAKTDCSENNEQFLNMNSSSNLNSKHNIEQIEVLESNENSCRMSPTGPKCNIAGIINEEKKHDNINNKILETIVSESDRCNNKLLTSAEDITEGQDVINWINQEQVSERCEVIKNKYMNYTPSHIGDPKSEHTTIHQISDTDKVCSHSIESTIKNKQSSVNFSFQSQTLNNKVVNNNLVHFDCKENEKNKSKVIIKKILIKPK